MTKSKRATSVALFLFVLNYFLFVGTDYFVSSLRSGANPRYRDYEIYNSYSSFYLYYSFSYHEPRERIDFVEFHFARERGDLFNQEIISYELTEKPALNQVVIMLKKAFKKIPNNTYLTLHSDQGWQYQMKQYQCLLKRKGIIQSMSRKGNCLDNAIIENFFGILKSELFYLKKYNSLEQLKKDIKEYIHY